MATYISTVDGKIKPGIREDKDGKTGIQEDKDRNGKTKTGRRKDRREDKDGVTGRREDRRDAKDGKTGRPSHSEAFSVFSGFPAFG